MSDFIKGYQKLNDCVLVVVSFHQTNFLFYAQVTECDFGCVGFGILRPKADVEQFVVEDALPSVVGFFSRPQ